MANTFSSQIELALNSYSQKTIAEVQAIIDSVSAEAVTELHSAYPGGTGEYNAGWTSKSKNAGNMYSRIIYGKSPTFRLAHLLEHGHAKRNGGRVAGVVHIQPIAQAALDKVIERMIAKL